MKSSDIRTKRYAKLVAIKFVYKKIYKHSRHEYWQFKCDCGNEKVIYKNHVIGGRVKSCGCLLKARQSTFGELWETHGMTDTRLYKIWYNMKNRCLNVKSPSYKNYGGRGISVEWNSFEEFRDDMYKSYLVHVQDFGEDNTQIERIDNNGNYSNKNCRWATKVEQMRNTRRSKLVLYCGKRMPVPTWAEALGMDYSFLRNRLDRGWSMERAVKTPNRNEIFYEKKDAA